MAVQSVMLTLPSPAKLNLFLHITGRRQDGYHLLQTAFQFLDYSDELQFNLRNDNVLNLTSIPGLEIPPEQNLIIRAARYLQDVSQTKLGADIYLTRRLPIGGGIGGGSSNAATTLLALNHLWQTQLSLKQLATLGLQLGADIPVFIQGHAAWAEGVGELLTPLQFPELWHVILVPSCQVFTALLYADAELPRNTPNRVATSNISTDFSNDFTAIVRKRFPPVAEALDWLNQFSLARLTGSGGCVFATFKDAITAKQVIQQLPASLNGFIAKSLNISPLHLVLNQLIY